MPGDLGPYREILDQVLLQNRPAYAYSAQKWADVEHWRTEARGKLHELMAFRPRRTALDSRVERSLVHDGLAIEEVSWEVGYGARCQGWVLKPAAARGKLPAVLALHDHGGFKYYGKEKIAETDHAFPLTREHREKAYGGVPWANALAKQGYVVLVHDNFTFGSRSLPIESLGERHQSRFAGLKPHSPELIQAYNKWAGEHEHILAKSFFTAGTTWPGILAFEDRRAVDYLCTRSDVDADRIGCGGLSGGGLRTTFLAGLDSRIRAAVCIGFMSTWEDFLHDKCYTHTWMLYVPGCSAILDFPDILSLRAPLATLVQYDEDDPLYTLKGQRDAHAAIARTYREMGASDRYVGSFYPGPHKFDQPMQTEAFEFFKKHLSI